MAAGNLELRLSRNETSAATVYLFLHRSDATAYYLYGQCTLDAADRWFCRMEPAQAPPRPNNRPGSGNTDFPYEAVLVEKLEPQPAPVVQGAPPGLLERPDEANIIHSLPVA